MKIDKRQLKKLAPNRCIRPGRIKTPTARKDATEMRDADRRASRKRINRLIDKQLEEDGYL